MKNLLIIFSLFLSGNVYSSTPDECKSKVEKARITLLVFMTGNQSERYKKLIKNSVIEADNCINSLNVDSRKNGILDELKTVWSQFKKTRESELIPALLNKEEAGKKLAMGKQKERIEKINQLLSDLNK